MTRARELSKLANTNVLNVSGTNVGIGTTTPSELLHLASSSASDTTLIRLDGGSGIRQRFFPSSGTSKFNWQIAVQTNVDNAFEITPSSTSGGSTFSTPAVVVKSDGKVGINNTSPSTLLDLVSSSDASITLTRTAAANAKITTTSNGALAFSLDTSGGNTERARIDSSGRLLVGTSTARANFYNGANTAQIQLEGTNYQNAAFAIVCNANSADKGSLILAKNRGTTVGSNTIVQDGDGLGSIEFQGSDGTEFVQAATIKAEVDGTPGANDMPCRIVLSTTADGASSPTERMRISNTGAITATASLSVDGITVSNTNGSFVNSIFLSRADRAASTAYYFFAGVSSASGSADNEFLLRGDGTGLCDGSWTGGGADYAEFFEWSDSNPGEEDRRGISVVLDGDKIREALTGEDPIGVISGNPSVVGDSAWNKWSGKYLRDEFGTYIQEDYEVTDDEGNTVIQQRRKLNPAYDPDVEYISREQRPEWDCVGLMGKLRIRKGQVTGSRWIKMRDISDSVEEWLVR